MISSKDAIKFYNSIGVIFRSLVDPTDNQAKMLANKYQDGNVVSDKESELIKSYLKSEVKQIKAPYTINLTNYFIRLYLVDSEQVIVPFEDGIDFTPIGRIFSDQKFGHIMIVDKDIFSMQVIYDTIEDKKRVFELYKKIFNAKIINGPELPEINLLDSMFAALFIYQVSGGHLSKEDFEQLVSGKHSDIYDAIEKIYNNVGANIPYITEGPELANFINDILVWTWFNNYK